MSTCNICGIHEKSHPKGALHRFTTKPDRLDWLIDCAEKDQLPEYAKALRLFRDLANAVQYADDHDFPFTGAMAKMMNAVCGWRQS